MPLQNWWQAVLVEDWQHGGFGLYVHWPFCESKCPYCDFNSYVSANVDGQAWEAALLSELDRHAELVPGRVLNSIFFGGGTPSLMSPKTIERLIDRATSQWTPANNIEITLEANPSSVEAARFAAYRSAGVNRVSVGVQALNDPDLKRLGRLHSVDEALRALKVAENTFDRFSFDLIYARQDQSLSAWQAELETALTYAQGHISLYQLTIEPETAFGARARVGKLPGLPDEDLSADMYEFTNATCEMVGLGQYEISNYAAPGQQSLHNLIYWNGGDYIGIGPGAHGRLTISGKRHATETALAPAAWLNRQQTLNNATTKSAPLSRADQVNEMLLMGLRVKSGISLDRIEQILGHAFEVPKTLVELGMVKAENGALFATDKGRPILNQVVQELMV